MSTPARLQLIPQYISELRSISGLYTGYIPNKYADQVSAEDFYTVLQNDPAVYHAMHLLSVMAVGEYNEIYCENTKLTLVIKGMLEQIGDFTHAQKSLIYGGVLFGLGLQRKYYRRGKIKDVPGNWMLPYKIQEVDRRRLMIERDTEDRTQTYWTMYSMQTDNYIRLFDRSENPESAEGEAVQDYIWYIHEWEELNPFFRGVGDAIFSLAYIKKIALQYWADLAESWSKPFLTVTTDIVNKVVNASLGAGFVSAEAAATQILEEFEKQRARHIAVVNSRDKLEWHEHGSSGNNIISELIQYCDQKIQLLILGAELTTQSSGAGSYALGAVHRQATDAIIMYNRKRLAEALEEGLIYDFCYRNRLNLLHIGIPFPAPGEIKIRFKVEQEEQKKQELQQKQGGGRNYPSQQG